MEEIVPFRHRHCDEVNWMRKTEKKERKHKKSMRIIALVLVTACLGLGFKTWQVHQQIECCRAGRGQQTDQRSGKAPG